MDWKTIERPGYFGKKRDELYNGWDGEFGENNWRLAYDWGELVIPRSEAIQLYEDGYYEFLKANPETLDWLVNTASDVYDTALSNVEAGFSYDEQETPNNHIHDVSIRRSVMRLARWFKGDHLMQVRAGSTEGAILSPHIVPFHYPEMIFKGEIKDYSGKGLWWKKLGIENSIEEFYQHNKILQIKDVT